jgi:hypothetical protein
MNPPEYDISVRELAEFVHRRGDLGGESTFRRSNRALEGIKGHKRIQQSRGSDYRAEVPVERSFVKGEVSLRVIGRVDGIVDGLTPLTSIQRRETVGDKSPLAGSNPPKADTGLRVPYTAVYYFTVRKRDPNEHAADSSLQPLSL